MPNALLTAVSGLLVHQRMLDTTSNNLANLNTTAYKGRRILFSDLDYEVIQPATTNGSGPVGGTNPNEIGSGVRVAQISRQLSQGNLEQTGEQWDMAISGEGYFILNNGVETLYTRAGAFSLDAQGYLVDPATGYRVQRFGTTGEPDGINPAFQTPGDNSIRVPIGTSVTGQPSTEATIRGNLPAASNTSTAQTASLAPFTTGVNSPATAGTLINALTQNTVDYVAGDVINIGGTDANGGAVSATFNVSGASTVQDLLNAINGVFTGATATLSSSGSVVLTSNQVGPSQVTLSLTNASGNTGAMATASLNPTLTAGVNGKTVELPLTVFDVQGGQRTVKANFTHVGANRWNMSLSGDNGTVISGGTVSDIVFSTDGSGIVSTGSGSTTIPFTASFNGAPPQTVNLRINGMTQVSSDASLTFERDGYGAGVLKDVRIQKDGIIQLVSTQDQSFNVAQLALASFGNQQGLSSAGENNFRQSVNSGVAQVGGAASGSRGILRVGHLEQSNVDVALEFTRLIVAQRGFSANSRVITVADQVLQELTNVIR